MILKGSQRSGGQDLAAHLMNAHDNEHVRLYELRGFAADNLKGAFKETEAISRATHCRQYLFSLSLSPPETARLGEDEFIRAIDSVEARLGLDGQPRAVVFHEKEGRRHAHCVWSRIDAETMTARPMSFFKTKLMGVSRDLYLEHGWALPRGMIEAGGRDPANFTLAEWQQAKRQGVDPRWLKALVQDCWKRADNAASFGQALRDHGLFLARGDRRGHVVLDHTGEVHALARTLSLKTAEVRARLGDGADLGSVADARKALGATMTPAMRRHVEESRDRFRERSAKLGAYKEEMTRHHRAARLQLETRQKVEREAEARMRAASLPRGLKGLWHRLTGEAGKTRARHAAEAEATRARQATARNEQIDAQRAQRAVLQEKFKTLRGAQAQQLFSLRQDIGRFLAFSRGQDASQGRAQDAPARGASQDTGAARGLGLRLER